MQIIFNILFFTLLYVLISFSFSIVYITTKSFNFCYAAIITLGAYFTFHLYYIFNISMWLSIIISILLSISISLLIELLINKPLRKRRTSSLLMLISSLSIYIILQNLISLAWGDDMKVIRTEGVKIGKKILGIYITNAQIIAVISCLILFIASLVFLKYHKIGRNIRAVASNQELSSIVGINSNYVILWCTIIGGGLASTVGILFSFDIGLTPTMGFNLLLYGIVAMIIGGIGSNWGLVGGALLLASAQNFTAFYFDSQWMDAITFAILILFLIWKPIGFNGNRLKKIEI